MRSECFNIQAFKLSATKRCSAVGGSSLLFTLLRATFLHSSPLFHRFTHLYIYFSSIRSLSASPLLVYLLRSNNFRLGDFFDIKTLEIKRSSLKVLSWPGSKYSQNLALWNREWECFGCLIVRLLRRISCLQCRTEIVLASFNHGIITVKKKRRSKS